MNILSGIHIEPLTRELAEKFSEEIISSLDQIPLTTKHSAEQLLSDKKGERGLFAKWQHSILMLADKEEFVGVAIGYERAGEGNDQYPKNCIYLNDFAIAIKYQKKGLGKMLLAKWIDHNTRIGMVHFHSPLYFAVQTNSADWNIHVQKLYEKIGFQKIAEKPYNNRKDNIYFLKP